MAKKKEDRGTPDAILYPEALKGEVLRAALAGKPARSLEPGEAPRLKMRGVQDRLADALGGQAWHTDAGGGWHLATLEPHPTLNHPQDHPTRPKMPRYDWVEQDDGILWGYLKPDEDEVEPAPRARRDVPRPPIPGEEPGAPGNPSPP
jgi:hypothetical protein